ncbi:serine protease [Roseomonas populi]|uniref:Serine protease n=1 Tax=Roseomonas populi TaxID=3121582 RepID=A0ABT1X8Z9_9PROT|nr:serine protease [Roseomonas pecuniae]MCR0983434.1 serine protease [Roseomonas pecuniae]
MRIATAFGAASLVALLLSACAERAPRPWTESTPTRTPEPGERLPDLPDAFRAELRGGHAPGCPLRGNAVYLGDGRFLTAAHLVDGIVPRLRHCGGTPIPTTVRYAGRTLAVRPLRVGEGYLEPGVGPLYKGGEDLALLQASASPPGPAARPCGAGPAPGQAVRISSSSQQGLAKAGAMVPETRKADGAYADIALPMAEGESGAGVFDPDTNCLLGIVSHRPDSTPDHSRIVPASTIRTFLGAEGVADLSGPSGSPSGAPRGLRPLEPPPGG